MQGRGERAACERYEVTLCDDKTARSKGIHTGATVSPIRQSGSMV